MKHLHVSHNDKFTDPYIQLINNYFDKKEHFFLILGKGIGAKITPSNNVVQSSKIVSSLYNLLIEMYRSDKIHIHGLFFPQIVLILFFQPWLLKKCNWIVWGGDLYCYLNNRKKLREKVKEVMRRSIIKKMGSITTLVRGDYELAVEWYGTKASYHHGIYINPISIDYLDKLSKKMDRETVNIQIGNSGDPSNGHMEVLHQLMKFKEENIKIFLPLSYGGSKEYIEEISKFGHEVFGRKFVPIMTFLKPDEYANYLSSIDVAIFNNDRQQGLGNIFALIYLNKKVFMRSDITSWNYVNKELGLKIYKFEKIYDIDFEEFITKELMGDNPKKVKKLFTEDYIVQVWKEVFDYKKKS